MVIIHRLSTILHALIIYIYRIKKQMNNDKGLTIPLDYQFKVKQ